MYCIGGIMKKLMLIILLSLFVCSFSFAQAGTNYILQYRIHTYDTKVGDSVQYFVDNVIKSGDQLIFLTPAKPYSFPKAKLAQIDKKTLAANLIKLLKKDTALGGAYYHTTFQEMERIIVNMARNWGTDTSTLKQDLIVYKQNFAALQAKRKFNKVLYQKIAALHKKQQGKNVMCIFLQKENKPIPDKDFMDDLMKNPKIKFDVMEAFNADQSITRTDLSDVIKAMNEAKLTFNMAFIKIQGKRKRNIQLRDISGDLYNLYKELVKGTDGKLISTSKPEQAIKEILK